MLDRARSVVTQTISAWSDDDAGLLGAGLAYYGLLSVAPLLVVVVSVLSLLVGERVARGEVQGVLRDWVGPAGTKAIREIVASANDTGAEGAAALIGGAVLLWGSTRLFAALQAALDRVFGVTPEPGQLRRWLISVVVKRIVGFLLVVGLGLVILASVFASSILVTASRLASDVLPVSPLLIQATDNGVLCVLLTGGFAVLFAALPDIRVRFIDVLPGAAVTAVLLVAAKHAIGWYLGTTGVVSTFGAAGAVIGVLFWMGWSFQCLLLGAEFTKVWANQVGGGIRPARGYRLVRRVPVVSEPEGIGEE
jgi:membrane protein